MSAHKGEKVAPIPDGYHTITPYVVVEDCKKLLDWLVTAFDAKVMNILWMPDGIKVANAEVQVGNSMMLFTDSMGPPAPTTVYMYVEDVDATYKKAMAAGNCTSLMEPTDLFYGNRDAGVKDFAGNSWWMASRKEILTNEEISARMAESKKPKTDTKE